MVVFFPLTMLLGTRSSNRAPDRGHKHEQKQLLPPPTAPPPGPNTSNEGENSIIRKLVKVLWFANMPPGQVNIHSSTLEPQLQKTRSPTPFPASPKEREPVPESFRENGPSSRSNGTAQGKRKPQGTSESKQACCEAGERKQEGWSARCPEIRGIVARCPAAPAQLQTGLLPGDLSAGLHLRF